MNAQTNNYRGSVIGTSATDLASIKSITYNDITSRLKGEEVADYTQNYNSAGTITSTATLYYMVGTLLKRAVGAGAEAAGGDLLVVERAVRADEREGARLEGLAAGARAGGDVRGSRRSMDGRGPPSGFPHDPIVRDENPTRAPRSPIDRRMDVDDRVAVNNKPGIADSARGCHGHGFVSGNKLKCLLTT